VIVCALVPVAGGAGPSATDLRQRGVQLSARSHAAVLELYSLDSQLSGARARLASARSEAARVRALRANVALRLGIARHALAVSNRALADRLRVLYEQGDADPMAILLGAQSLDEAVTRLDDLHSAAVQDETVISQTRQARRSLLRLRATLAARQRHLDALAGEAQAAVAQLERTRAARSAYVAQLRAEEQLNSTRLTAVQSRAAAAAHKAAQLSAVPSAAAPAPGAPPAVGAAPVAGGRTLTVLATGYSLTGTTSTGLPVGWGVAAVDPSVIPLGTHMTVPGYGEAVAADTGGNVGGATIDLWFPSAAKALAWGRRSVTITLH
jgi:3D (Asp-Asp-Asp) domain-containing protein